MKKDLKTWYIRNAKFGVSAKTKFIQAMRRTLKIQNHILRILLSGIADGTIEKVDKFKIYFTNEIEYNGEIGNYHSLSIIILLICVWH